MHINTKRSLVGVIIILGLIGMLTSIYLTAIHYKETAVNQPCDINPQVSCSTVNSSAYSEFYGIPVAGFGVLFFLITLFMCWLILKKDKHYHRLMYWHILGLLFVIYFIVIEVILRTVCPLCSLVHVIVIITLILSILIYRAETQTNIAN